MAVDQSQRSMVWDSGINYARKADRFWTLKATLIGLIFWVIRAILSRFDLGSLGEPTIMLAVLMIYSVGLYVFFEFRGITRAGSRQELRLKALLLQQYNSFFLAWLSVEFLFVALEFISEFGPRQGPFSTGLILAYSISIVLGVLWAPRSIPKSSKELDAAMSGDAKVLPYILGCQSSVVGIGAFLSALILHDESGIGLIFVASLSSISALLLSVFSVLGMYRALIMMKS